MFGRKMAYTLLLVYYYTFVVVYSWILGYIDVIAVAAAIIIVTYVWLIRTASKIGVLTNFNYKDLIGTVFVYAFVDFYIAGTVLFFSPTRIDFIHAFLMFTPIVMWMFVWTDYYMQRMKGRNLDK